MKLHKTQIGVSAIAVGFTASCYLPLHGQQADEQEDEIFELSPFTVEGSEDEGYRATNTLAGTRIKSQLKDIGTSVQVVTEDFLDDIGAVSMEDLLTHTTNTEVGGISGNFSGFEEMADNGGHAAVLTAGLRAEPQLATRVRGLGRADLTRSYFKTSIPFDRYNTSRIDINRGSNATLFGLGSPSGIINNNLDQATFSDAGKFVLRLDGEGSVRGSLSVNRVLIEDKLAVKFALLEDQKEYRQKPTYSDTTRKYAAIKFKPLKHTTFRADFEDGDIDSRRPDTISPIENISAWFANDQPIIDQRISSGIGLEGGTGLFVDGVELTPDQITENQFHTYIQRSYDGSFIADPETYGFKKGLLTSGRQPLVQLDTSLYPAFTDSTTQKIANARIFNEGILVVSDPNATGFDPVGFIGQPNKNHNVAGDALSLLGDGKDEVKNFVAVRNLSDFLPHMANTGRKKQGLLNYDMFDFSKNLLSGGSSFQDTEFDAATFALEQTFLDGKLGFELSYNKQHYMVEAFAPIQHRNASIWVDINTLLPNGDANPNFGRPFVHAEGGFSGRTEKVETKRFTGFVSHDFGEQFDSGIGRFLGAHTLSGLVDRFESEEFRYSKGLYFQDTDTQRVLLKPQIGPKGANNHPIVYVGPSILGARSMSDVALTGASHDLNLWRPGETVQLKYFDPGASASDPTKNNTKGDIVTNGQIVTRSATLVEALGDNPQRLYNDTDSEAFVLQSKFLGNHVVTTFGYRQDDVIERNFNKVALDPDTGIVLIDELEDQAPDINGGSDDRTSFSGVVHWPQDWGLPDSIGLSFHYADSSNFQLLSRENWRLDSIPNPAGETSEEGISLRLFEDKLHIRFNRYETSLVGASSSSRIDTFNLFRYANSRYENFDSEEDAVWQAFHKAVGDTVLNSLPEKLVAGNSLNYETNANGDRIGFTFTNAPVTDTVDRVAKGEEIEITYNPTKNWRVSASLAKQETVRNNINPWFENSGQAFMENYLDVPIEGYEWITIGDLPASRGFNSGGYFLDVEGQRFLQGSVGEDGSEDNLTPVETTQVDEFAVDLISQRTDKSQEGAVSTEQRKWRFNLVTNYRFSDGRFKGLSIGGSYRWQDAGSLGYPYMLDENGQIIGDVSRPIMGDEISTIDLFTSYRMPFFQKYGSWRLQFNVRNAFADDNFIPLQLQGRPLGGTVDDYTVARVRAPSPTEYFLTSTFDF
ncbi:TonB-dependent receptor [Pelagicoccus mobilis]|uniref:TonB-dependent receptor n=1 Tax=Pelagicoccus mobilis TaxID=415221 RepID=A0A934VR78_9BACT|nr:TonB-dependent receptor [Pelagicoccus mobilis]MBK1877640.1 TonB-dependent receptor [Pelagicoccus mobilis]